MLQAINQQVAIELLKKGVRTETKRHKALVNSKKAAWKARQAVSAEAPPVCCGRGHAKSPCKEVVAVFQQSSSAARLPGLRTRGRAGQAAFLLT